MSTIVDISRHVASTDGHNQIFMPFKYRPGGIWSDGQLNFDNQIFSHFDMVDYVYRHFHVKSLHHMIKKKPGRFTLQSVRLTAEQVEFVLRNSGVEGDHLERLTERQLAQPGIGISFPDHTNILVDGNHRFVRRFQLGLSTMQVWDVPLSRAEPCMLDLPDHVPGTAF